MRVIVLPYPTANILKAQPGITNLTSRSLKAPPQFSRGREQFLGSLLLQQDIPRELCQIAFNLAATALAGGRSGPFKFLFVNRADHHRSAGDSRRDLRGEQN